MFTNDDATQKRPPRSGQLIAEADGSPKLGLQVRRLRETRQSTQALNTLNQLPMTNQIGKRSAQLAFAIPGRNGRKAGDVVVSCLFEDLVFDRVLIHLR
jgi:hypothetical protein